MGKAVGAVKPPFCVPAYCVSRCCSHFPYGPGQMPVRTTSLGSYTFLDFTPFIGGRHSNIQLGFYFVSVCDEMSVFLILKPKQILETTSTQA